MGDSIDLTRTGLMMLMGGHVLGNKVHGQWPGLADSQLVGPATWR